MLNLYIKQYIYKTTENKKYFTEEQITLQDRDTGNEKEN